LDSALEKIKVMIKGYVIITVNVWWPINRLKEGWVNYNRNKGACHNFLSILLVAEIQRPLANTNN
jgi:hypothetical protein